MNIAIILGRMTRDPDIKVSQSGMTIARFTLAVNRGYKKDQKQEADFKGQRLLVEGRIQTGHYTDKNGETKYTTEIAVSRSEFVEKRSESSTQGNYHSSNQNAPPVGFEQMGTEVNDTQWMEQEDLPF